MTTETILTEELIDELAEKYLWGDAQFIGAGEVTVEGEEEFARAIEQAVMQSEQVQAWKRDAAQPNRSGAASRLAHGTGLLPAGAFAPFLSTL